MCVSSSTFIVLAQLSKVVGFTAAVLISPTVIALLLAGIVQAALQFIVLCIYCYRRFGPFWQNFDGSFFLEQFQYVAPFGLYGWMNLLQTDMHNYFVSVAFGASTFAIYAVGFMQIPLIGLLRESVNSVLIGRTSILQRSGAHREVFGLIASACRKVSLAYFPMFVLMSVLAREIIVVLYTTTYEASAAILRINLLLIPLGVFFTDPVVRAYKELTGKVVRIRLVIIAGVAIVLWLGVRSLGLTGAATVVVLSALIERVIVMSATLRVLEVKRSDLKVYLPAVKIFLLSLIAGCVTVLVRGALLSFPPFVVLLVSSAVFVLCYAGLILWFRVLLPEEAAAVTNRLHSLGRRVGLNFANG